MCKMSKTVTTLNIVGVSVFSECHERNDRKKTNDGIGGVCSRTTFMNAPKVLCNSAVTQMVFLDFEAIGYSQKPRWRFRANSFLLQMASARVSFVCCMGSPMFFKIGCTPSITLAAGHPYP